MDSDSGGFANREKLVDMTPHEEADSIFGPCLIPDCPGSVWAVGAHLTLVENHPDDD